MEKLNDLIHIPHIAEHVIGLLCLLLGMAKTKKAKRIDRPLLGENVPHTLMESVGVDYDL